MQAGKNHKNRNWVEGSSRQATILVPELQIQQLETRQTEQNKLRRENKAWINDWDYAVKWSNQKKQVSPWWAHAGECEPDHGPGASEKAVSKAEALFKLQQTKEALQRRKESQQEQEMCLTKVVEVNNCTDQDTDWAGKSTETVAGGEVPPISDIQHVLQEREKIREARWVDMKDRVSNLEAQKTLSVEKIDPIILVAPLLTLQAKPPTKLRFLVSNFIWYLFYNQYG